MRWGPFLNETSRTVTTHRLWAAVGDAASVVSATALQMSARVSQWMGFLKSFPEVDNSINLCSFPFWFSSVGLSGLHQNFRDEVGGLNKTLCQTWIADFFVTARNVDNAQRNFPCENTFVFSWRSWAAVSTDLVVRGWNTTKRPFPEHPASQVRCSESALFTLNG